MEERQKQLVALVKRYADEYICGIEVGVSKGKTSAILLKVFPHLTLSMVDPWQVWPADHPYRQTRDCCSQWTMPEAANAMMKAGENTDFAQDRRCIFRGLSLAIAEEFADETQEFIFIDGDHRYESVLADCRAWWPKLRNNGRSFLAGHDYGNTGGSTKGVTPAWDEFAREVKRELHVGSGYMAWLETGESKT